MRLGWLAGVCGVTFGMASAGHAQEASVTAVAARVGSSSGEAVSVTGAPALARFHHALRELAAGQRSRVRVMHYGDSNVAAGLWPRAVRDRLQRRFGDGGAGYVVPRPWGSFQWRSARITGAERWHPRRLGAGARFGPPDGLWGLAGVALTSAGRQQVIRIELPADVDRRLVVHALGWRRGGRLALRVDDGPVTRISTRRRSVGPVAHRVLLSPGPHVLRVWPDGWRPVRLLGFDLERDRPGVVYDVLGINGHRADALLRWDRALWAAQARGREPDLLVLAYGGNEALDPALRMARYEPRLRASIRRARAVFPRASCLVVAPVAQCDEPHRVTDVVAAQRRVAAAQGCGFWDTTAVSGGPSSLCGWIRRGGLVSGDHLHLTPDGYRVVGDRFADALLEGL